VKALIFSSGPALSTLAKPLSEKYQLVLLYGNNTGVYQQAGIKHVTLDQFLGEGAHDFTWNEAAKFIRKLDVKDWHIPEAHKWFLGWLTRMWQSQILWIELLDTAAKNFEIAGVVVHEDVSPQMKNACLWAKARGIPSLQVTHASYGEPGHETDSNIHCVLNTDYVSCTGPKQARFFEGVGINPSRIRANGMPVWDIWTTSERNGPLAKAQMRVPDDKPTICFLNGWVQANETPETIIKMESMYRAILNITKRKGWGLIVKVHPAAEQNQKLHTKAWHADIAKSMECHATIVSDAGQNLIAYNASDCVVGPYMSTMMTEAAILGIPGGGYPNFDTSDEYGWPMPLQWNPETQEADLERDVETMLTPEWKAANNDGRVRHIYDYGGLCDGRATERVLNWIQELMPAGE
jgi:hypothetical protein